MQCVYLSNVRRTGMDTCAALPWRTLTREGMRNGLQQFRQHMRYSLTPRRDWCMMNGKVRDHCT